MDIVAALLRESQEMFACLSCTTKQYIEASGSLRSFLNNEIVGKPLHAAFVDIPEDVAVAIFESTEPKAASLQLCNNKIADIRAQRVHWHNEEVILLHIQPHSVMEKDDEATLIERLSLLSNMNHELRSPLNPIVGFSDLLLDDPDLSKDQRSYVQVIKDSGHRLLELLEQTIEFARSQTGTAPHQTRPVHIFPVLMKIKTQLGDVCSANKLDIALHNDVPTKQKFLLDSRLTDKVLGHITSELASFSRRDNIDVHVRATDTTLLFTIRLFSSTLTQSDIDRWLQPFSGGLVVGDDAAKDLDRNLLFSIARSEITAHGGSLSITAANGVCELVVELLSEEINFELETPTPTTADIESSVATSGILIAEDLEFNRMYFAAMLHDENVEFVNDGASALKRVKAAPPEVLVMDIRLPHMSGREVLAELRSSGVSSLPIVLISADSDPSHQEFAKQNKAVFLPKPITKAKLLNAIAEAKQQVTIPA